MKWVLTFFWLAIPFALIRAAGQDSIVLSSERGDAADELGAFHLLAADLSGGVEVVARLATLDSKDPWARAGLILRENVLPGSRYVMLVFKQTNGVSFQYRLNPGDTSGADMWFRKNVLADAGENDSEPSNSIFAAAGGPLRAKSNLPLWLKLLREGNTYRGYCSTNGSDWIWLGTQEIPITNSLSVGIVTFSRHSAAPCVVTADQFSARQLPPSLPATRFIGAGDGLAGSYYANLEFKGAPSRRIDPQLNFNWSTEPPLVGIPRETFAVRWEGALQAQVTEPCVFHVVSDDRARLWVNGRLLIDDPSGHPAEELSTALNLTAGQQYLLRLEYFQNGKDAVAQLLWSSPSTPKQIIPQTQLYSQVADSDNDGLPDIWEIHFFLKPLDAADAALDPDGDGFTNLEEFLAGTNPLRPERHLAALPSPWMSQDIGNPGQRGAARFNAGQLIISGSGADIWGNADGFHFVAQQLTGDSELIARVLSLQNTDPWAKACLMMRRDLTESSPHAMVCLSPENGISFQYRHLFGDATTDQWGGPASAGCWLRLLRRGDRLTAFRSPDGQNWEWLGSEAIPMPQTIFVGLGVSSHDNSRLCSAIFDRVAVTQLQTSSPSRPVVGQGDGLLGSYFDTGSGITVNRLDRTIDFDWGLGPPAESIASDNLTARWQGIVEAQFSEVYAFHVLSDDGARLWVDGQKIIDAWRDQPATRVSAKIPLLAGHRYVIKLEFYEKAGQALTKLFWSSPSTAQQIIPQSQLYSPGHEFYSQIEDKDHDQILDAWEVLYALDPADAGDASADPDADGLTNFREFVAGTNPRKSDSDGDGLPDAWEVAVGLNPVDPADRNRDSDYDALDNLQEYQAGTNPLLQDTDADGLADGTELHETQTSPLADDIQTILNVAEVPGAAAISTLGRWSVQPSSIRSQDRRGYVEYSLAAPNAGMYRLEIEGQPASSEDQQKCDLLLWIDGESLGRSVLLPQNGLPSNVHCLTPWLKSGNHRVRIYWDNSSRYRSLEILAVRLQALQGTDSNNNGIADWAENRLAKTCGLEVFPAASLVSPLCIEGRGHYLSMMSISGDITPEPAAGDRWFANLPLSATNPITAIISFQNDAVKTTNRVVWRRTNLLLADNTSIRRGDSLLLAAAPTNNSPGIMEIVIEGVTNYTSVSSEAVPHQFDQPGTFSVTGTFIPTVGTPQTRAISVTVVEASLPPRPAVWVGNSRWWDCPDLPSEAVVQAGPGAKLELLDRSSDGDSRFSLSVADQEYHRILARLGPDGPILASSPAEGFRLFSSWQTDLQVLEEYSDGMRLIQMGVVLSPFLPQVTVRLNIIVGGITFDDGTLTKELSAADFNELGEVNVRFIMPAGVMTSACHTTKAFQDSIFLGIHPR